MHRCRAGLAPRLQGQSKGDGVLREPTTGVTVSSTTTNPAPIAPKDRIEALDVIRGFALFGIFLVNIEWFTRPWQELGAGMQAGTAALDHTVDWLVYLAARGKFWVLFSLLFGMGFAVMSGRLTATGRDFGTVYLRRSAVLMVFGIAHAVLLWSGDILHGYALAALALLLLARGMQPASQLYVGASIYLLFALLATVSGIVAADVEAPDAPATAAEAAAAAQVYAHGDYPAVTAQRARDFMFELLPHDIDIVPMAFSVFLCGAWFVRSGRIGDVVAHMPFFRGMAIIGLAVGAAFTAVILFGPQGLSGGALLLGSAATALGYLGAIAWLLARPATARYVAWLAPVGRMALSNYLLQSLLASTIFYGYGLGLWGRIGRTGQVLLVVAIFAAQALLSRWWLSRYRFGPVEWLWRWGTYGRRPAMKVA
jgi:uncharacterized protein